MSTKGYNLAESFTEPKTNTIKYNKLQRQETSKSTILKLNFTKTLYKTATEILLQPNQTYKEKYIEWLEINKEHKGLVVNNKYPEYIENLFKYNKELLKQEELYKESLLMEKAIEEGKIKIINNL